MFIYILALEVIIIMRMRISKLHDEALGGDHVIWKEYGYNLQDTFRLIGSAITMTT